MSATPVRPEGFVEAIERIRKRADVTAKTVGGLGTTAVTAVGFAKFADVFPWPPGQERALIGVLAGFIAMALTVAIFTARLWRVNAAIVFKTDVDAMDDLDPAEKEIARPIYEETAVLNGASSLAAYERRKFRLLRVAQRVGDDLAATVEAKVDEIGADVHSAQTRAAAIVVRRRASHAVTDVTAGALYAFLMVAVIVFGISADRLDSERSGRIQTAKTCVEGAAAKALLPPICDSVEVPKPTAAEKRQQAIESLGTALGKCEAARENLNATDPCREVFKAQAAGR